jgi:hypothetical protein
MKASGYHNPDGKECPKVFRMRGQRPFVTKTFFPLIPGISNLIILLIVSALALCACSSAPLQRGTNEFVIKGVPFYPQEDYQCGPASLAGVLNFWGANVSDQEIASEIFSKSARGTLTIDMLLYAQRKGYDSLQYQGGIDDLKAKVRAGYPLIVLVDYGFFVYQKEHFMVVIGYDDNGIIANSGRTEKEYITNEKMVKIWQRDNYWTLWIKPKSKDM